MVQVGEGYKLQVLTPEHQHDAVWGPVLAIAVEKGCPVKVRLISEIDA